MKRRYRITAVVVSIFFGISLVFLLLIAGNKLRGPLGNFLSHAQETVILLETKLIVNQRMGKRENKLKWLRPYKNNMALLKNPDRFLFGAYDNSTSDNFEGIVHLEDSLHTTLPLIQIYTAWGDKFDEKFPKFQVEGIVELGSIPVITWEPWLTDFDETKHPGLPPLARRDKRGLADVAQGVYDFYLTEWAREAKKVRSPIFLRVAHEMNDPYRYAWGPQNNSPKDFKAAWIHMHELFEKEGATNILWVWSPHPAYGMFKDFYPGPSYVDYVGSGVLNYGTVASWSKWWSFKEIFGDCYNRLAIFNKPIMIAEFGSLTIGGDRSEWFAEALDSLQVNYPAVKSIVFFHYSDDRTATKQSLNWYLTDDYITVNTIKDNMSSIQGYEKH